VNVAAAASAAVCASDGAPASCRPFRRLPGGERFRRLDAGGTAGWKPALQLLRGTDRLPRGAAHDAILQLGLHFFDVPHVAVHPAVLLQQVSADFVNLVDDRILRDLRLARRSNNRNGGRGGRRYIATSSSP
jgi:hypothetical protein